MQPDEGGWPAGAEAQRGARPPAREAGERGTPGAMPPSPTPTALVSGVGTVGTVRHLGAAPAGRGSARTSEPRGLSLAPGPTSFSSVPAHPCRRGVRLPSRPLPKVCWKRRDGGGRRAPRAKRDRARRPGREEAQHRPLWSPSTRPWRKLGRLQVPVRLHERGGRGAGAGGMEQSQRCVPHVPRHSRGCGGRTSVRLVAVASGRFLQQRRSLCRGGAGGRAEAPGSPPSRSGRTGQQRGGAGGTGEFPGGGLHFLPGSGPRTG